MATMPRFLDALFQLNQAHENEVATLQAEIRDLRAQLLLLRATPNGCQDTIHEEPRFTTSSKPIIRPVRQPMDDDEPQVLRTPDADQNAFGWFSQSSARWSPGFFSLQPCVAVSNGRTRCKSLALETRRQAPDDQIPLLPSQPRPVLLAGTPPRGSSAPQQSITHRAQRQAVGKEPRSPRNIVRFSDGPRSTRAEFAAEANPVAGLYPPVTNDRVAGLCSRAYEGDVVNVASSTGSAPDTLSTVDVSAARPCAQPGLQAEALTRAEAVSAHTSAEAVDRSRLDTCAANGRPAGVSKLLEPDPDTESEEGDGLTKRIALWESNLAGIAKQTDDLERRMMRGRGGG